MLQVPSSPAREANCTSRTDVELPESGGGTKLSIIAMVVLLGRIVQDQESQTGTVFNALCRFKRG